MIMSNCCRNAAQSNQDAYKVSHPCVQRFLQLVGSEHE